MADKFLDKTGLAYFWEKIKAYFQSQHITPPEYTIVRLANEEVGYAASYVLKKDGTQVGATINIPKVSGKERRSEDGNCSRRAV